MNRLAGKALSDFLKAVYGSMSSGVESAVYNKLTGLSDATGLIGLAVRYPEQVSKLAGAAAPLAATAAVTAGAAGVKKLMQQQPQGEFSKQQYVPGQIPMSNWQAGQAALGRQKYQQDLGLIQANQLADMVKIQNQLQLIRARQAAQDNVGIANRSGAGIDIMNIAKQVYTPVNY